MSEQNPPGQPTPSEEHVEGDGPTTSEGAAPPPPPPVDGEDTTVDGEYPPPPPAKKSNAPWIIAVAAVLVVALVAGAGIVAFKVLHGEDKHSIAIPSTAGGMKRDITKPKWQLVTHMFNHQTHHRGQVHCMLTQAGAKPRTTDLIALPESP